jgi:cyclic-di-GMP-binding protein
MPSFDVVSEIDTHELTNAVDQASRELAQRFDFKGTGARFELLEETTVTMIAEAEFQLKQMLEILKLKVAKRGIDIICLDVKDPTVNLARATQLVVLKHGIDAETGRKVARLVKDSKIKVQAQIQGDKVRVVGKKRDDLQEAIALLRKAEVGRPAAVQQFPRLIRPQRRRPRVAHRLPLLAFAAPRCGGALPFECALITVPSSLTMMASMSSMRL